jgi:type I restriction enzyme R subunit
MSSVVPTSANFDFLREHDDELVRLGALAERYFRRDPNTCLIKLRQFGEVLARLVGAKIGVDRSRHAPHSLQGDERQVDLLRQLERRQITSREEGDLFTYVRINGNKAAHDPLWGPHLEALRGLKIARDLGSWFHRTFGNNPKFTPGSFVPPPDPAAEMETLRTELARLQKELVATQLAAERARVEAEEQQRSRLSAEERVRKEQEDKGTWEQLAKDLDAAQEALVGRSHGCEPPRLQCQLRQDREPRRQRRSICTKRRRAAHWPN